MKTLTLGLFHNQDNAENALHELSQNGFSSKDISIIMKDRKVAKEIVRTTESNVADGIMTGVTTGGVLGGVTGLLVGIGAVIIPGMGAVLIAGPIALALGLTGATASTVSGVLTGALAGGLLGGLIGLGLPEEEARVYEKDIKTGAILLGISTETASESMVRHILQKHDAAEVRSIHESLVTQ
ncbi:general stress protein [Candidatus Peregrinibacteria bacterium]|nr:general stress protein [Candidatus Peregrinibacteria bacterium]